MDKIHLTTYYLENVRNFRHGVRAGEVKYRNVSSHLFY